MSNKNISSSSRVAADQKLIFGMQKHAASLPATIILAGKAYTQADCANILQARVTTTQLSEAAKAARKKAVQDDHDEQSATKSFVLDLKAWFILTYSNDPVILSDYGLAPKKKTGVMTAETKVTAADKARATRKARHTVGPKAKKAIKGTLAVPENLPPEPAAAVSPGK